MSILSRSMIICLSFVATSAYGAKRDFCGFAVVGGGLNLVSDPLRIVAPEERQVLDALLWHEGRQVRWTDAVVRAVGQVLERGRHGRPLSDEEFTLMKVRLEREEGGVALVDVLRRARGHAFADQTVGDETALTRDQMIAYHRDALGALIAQGGFKMEWDFRLNAVAHYVIQRGLARDVLLKQDYDYLTRALRNGGSNPKMVAALMRVLRGPNL